MMIESKYDFDLDMVNTNSLSLIIGQIKRGTKVLEFGPANGRMTKYLKEALDCEVYLVEIDEEAGRQALSYGKDLIVDDIENYSWIEHYENLRFDYITFADVLEHLHDPEKVLVKAKGLLKQDGSILISVPNLAHNSVLINLINNEFEYNKVGLLDNTHIHFFTKNSLENMMNRTGLHVAKRFATYAQVGTTEIPNTYHSVPGIDATFWRNRLYGDIYQFVYEVKKGDEFITNRESYLTRGVHPYFIQVFFDYGHGYTEASSRTFTVDNEFVVQEIEFDMESDVRAVRLDPFNGMCMIDVEAITDQVQGKEKELRFMESNADHRDGSRFVFTAEDPYIMYLPAEGRSFHHIKIKLRYLTVDSIKVKAIKEIFASVVGNTTNQLKHMTIRAEAAETQLDAYREEIKRCEAKYKAQIADYESQKKMAEEMRMGLEQKVAELNAELNARTATLNEALGSTSWKVTKPLRKIGDVFRGRDGK